MLHDEVVRSDIMQRTGARAIQRGDGACTALQAIQTRVADLVHFAHAARANGRDEPVRREIWERCQEILDGRDQRKDRRVKHDFAFSGLLNCGHCGCSLVGELKKGRYVYHHCTGYRGKCPEPDTREGTLVSRFAEQLRALTIPPAVIEWLREELVASDVTQPAAREQALRRYQTEVERLQMRLDILYDDRLDGRIDAGTYDKKAEEIRGQQQRALTKTAECQSTRLAPATEALDLMSLTSKAAELLEQQCASERGVCFVLLCRRGCGKRESCGPAFGSRSSNCDYRTPQPRQETDRSR
jgi:hypothetical protein